MSTISIITRTVGRPVLLERTLKSILAQSFADWTWVVVDSGDGESTAKLIEDHASKLGGRALHLRFTNPAPGMRGLPINAGIEATDSEFITLLDDDDTWAPDYLETMVGALENPPHASALGAVCRTTCIEESGVEDGLVQNRTWELNPDLHNLTLPQLAVVNRFCTHAFAYSRAALEKVGLYPADYPVLEDWHFNLRFLLHYEILVIPKSLTNYHLRPPETTGHEANSQAAELGDHKFHEARLINEALRDDFKTGTLGLGHVLSQASISRPLSDATQKTVGLLKNVGDKIGKINSRTKALKDKLT